MVLSTSSGMDGVAAAQTVVSLHGVLHSNGHGHVRHVNGTAEHTGTHMMDVWDALCVALGVKSVSVQDVAARASMYLRLTHAVAAGRTWYGKWGYRILRGSFGLNREDYLAAVEGLQRVTLAELVAELRSDASVHVAGVEQLIARYTAPTILTLSQLLAHIMSLARSAGGGSGGDPAACSDLQHLYSALASLSQPAQVRSMYRDTSTCGTAAGECSDVKRWVATVMDCK